MQPFDAIPYVAFRTEAGPGPVCVHNAASRTEKRWTCPLKFRLFRRRLTISSPRMAIRSSLPWPLRWIAGALMLGFSAAIALWAFEFGKSIAGLDTNAKQELSLLRQEVASLRSDRDKAQSIVNTSGSLLTAEKALQEKMMGQIRQLESDNRSCATTSGFSRSCCPRGRRSGLAAQPAGRGVVGDPAQMAGAGHPAAQECPGF